jgi:flagellar biosynthesis protein
MRRKKAVALAYSNGESAPRITAKGRGREAERILQLARASGVSIIEESSLAELLEPLGIGAFVPEDCWEAVARVLAFVMKLEEGK